MRYALRVLHYSYKTEKAYIPWIYQFVVFHNKRHPAEMGEKEIREFLTHLAVKEKVSASTLSFLSLYYQKVGEKSRIDFPKNFSYILGIKIGLLLQSVRYASA